MKPTYEETFDPLTIRGIELCGEYFTDCNLLVDIIAQDMKAYEELERERNELAAQVWRLRECATPAIKLMRATGELSGWHEKADLIESVISETQPTALAALKARWQADILAEISLQVSASKPVATPIQIATAIMKESNKIRNSAQEAGDE